MYAKCGFLFHNKTNNPKLILFLLMEFIGYRETYFLMMLKLQEERKIYQKTETNRCLELSSKVESSAN